MSVDDEASEPATRAELRTTALPARYYSGRDGAELAYRETGDGRALVLIHGLFSTATVNWLRYGHAAALAARGYRVIMPDLRAHGDSDASHERAAYPSDVLAEDGLALLDELALTDYDLGGYSLGGRTAIRMMARGAMPGRAVISGTGLEPILDGAGRGGHFRHLLTHLGTFERGSSEWLAEKFLRSNNGDPAALLLLLESTVDTPLAELASIDVPTQVLMGSNDDDHGSGAALADALGHGSYVTAPGTHMSAVTKPELASMIGDYLADPARSRQPPSG